MGLNKQDETILQEIVSTDGNCLKSERCAACPFRSMCLPEFLFPKPPTQQQRRDMALKVLTHSAIFHDEEPEKEYSWPSQRK